MQAKKVGDLQKFLPDGVRKDGKAQSEISQSQILVGHGALL